MLSLTSLQGLIILRLARMVEQNKKFKVRLRLIMLYNVLSYFSQLLVVVVVVVTFHNYHAQA